MGRALERCRAGEGPYALEIVCSRFLGHFIGDPQGYRLPEELAQARANDPLPRFRTGVTEAGVLDHADLDTIEQEVLADVEDAVEKAMAADRPSLKTLETDVYVRY
jgi:TPP-dependent pyruvate/acetoin dehydrogenase alpha subunit